MKESSPFLNILVPLRANRARTILYFIRYQEGPTRNERGSCSGTGLFLRIYPLFRLFLSSLSPLPSPSFSLFFLPPCANPSCILFPFTSVSVRGGCRNLRSCFISAERPTLRHGPSNVGLIQNRCATHRSLDRPR